MGFYSQSIGRGWLNRPQRMCYHARQWLVDESSYSRAICLCLHEASKLALNSELINCPTNWLADGLITSLHDWCISRLPACWPACWLTDCLTDKLPDEWLADLLPDWMTEWTSDWPTACLLNCPSVSWLAGCRPVCLTACKLAWLPAWLAVCLAACLTACPGVCLPAWLTVCLPDCLPACLPARLYDWLSNWLTNQLNDCLTNPFNG